LLVDYVQCWTAESSHCVLSAMTPALQYHAAIHAFHPAQNQTNMLRTSATSLQLIPMSQVLILSTILLRSSSMFHCACLLHDQTIPLYSRKVTNQTSFSCNRHQLRVQQHKLIIIIIITLTISDAL